MDYTISAFAEKLLQEKGISGLSQEVMDQLRDDLVDRAENIINAEILANMPKEALGEFEEILKTTSMNSIILDYQSIMERF